MTKERKEFNLPTGIRVGVRPEDIEFFASGRAKWIDTVKALQEMGGTATLQVDITGLDKKRIISIRAGINGACKKMGVKRPLKSGIKANTMHLWLK